MDKLLASQDKENKDKHVKHLCKQHEHFSPLFSSVDGMLRKDPLVVLTNLIELMVEKLRDPFHTYVYGSTPGSQSRSQRCITTLSAYLSSLIPCGTKNQTGARG